MADRRGNVGSDCEMADTNAQSETNQLLNTLYINALVFFLLVIFFECNRHMRSIYLKRLTKERLVDSGRVPLEPPRYFLGWVVSLAMITEDDLLEMVGLDGYMLMRYINICFRICAFLTFWGLAVLVPVYASSDGKRCGWSRFTLANISNDYTATQLWAPSVLAYIFAAYFCQMMHAEYKNFLEKRVRYLILGDPSTPHQAYYTIMVERIPASLRSVAALQAFFENLFPNEVYAVELASDLHALDDLVAQRRAIRDKLEKAIAIWRATGERPTTVLSEDVYSDSPDPLLPQRKWGFRLLKLCGLVDIDAIEHYSRVLGALNESVVEKQSKYFAIVQHELNNNRSHNGDGGGNASSSSSSASVPSLDDRDARSRTLKTARAVEVTSSLASAQESQTRGIESMRRVDLEYERSHGGPRHENACAPDTSSIAAFSDPAYPSGFPSSPLASANELASQQQQQQGTGLPGMRGVTKARKAAMLTAPRSSVKPDRSQYAPVEGLAKEGLKTVEATAKGAVRGVLEAARTLELLTVGAYYATSSTAFVTFKSRTASSTSHQILLSHKHFTMVVRPAPNPKDIIWENVSIPQRQIDIRRNIADVTLVVGALFWSIVLGAITTISNLESLSNEYPWLKAYSNTEVYKFVNSYLASSLLLGLLSLLPLIFDVIARNYEGLKLESEIQNSIMTRYFYYQLANVFVSVYAGSIMTAIHQILDSPSNIFSILGATIPSFSVYFANVIIVKTFTVVPLELLRVLALVQILSLKMCLDRKKCTWRELRTGAFADPPLLYGWIYPSLMMVLMIVITYACISPLLTPFGLMYYALAYLLYKYQLLYVYVNDYQSGGFMWYAVFTRSMTALICGTVTLICYLGIRKTNISGPFYSLIPLPFLIGLFWYYCEAKFRNTSTSLSLESAIDLDRDSLEQRRKGIDPFVSFKPKLFRQPSLAEGPLRPAPYRRSQDGAYDDAAGHLNSASSAVGDQGGTSDYTPSISSRTAQAERERQREREREMEEGQPRGVSVRHDSGSSSSSKSLSENISSSSTSSKHGHPASNTAHSSPYAIPSVNTAELDPSSHAYRLERSFPSHEFEAEDSADEGETYLHMTELLDGTGRAGTSPSDAGNSSGNGPALSPFQALSQRFSPLSKALSPSTLLGQARRGPLSRREVEMKEGLETSRPRSGSGVGAGAGAGAAGGGRAGAGRGPGSRTRAVELTGEEEDAEQAQEGSPILDKRSRQNRSYQ